MITFLILVFLLFLVVSPFLYNDTVIISLSKSFLIGALYDKAFLEDEKIYIYTVQFSFVFIIVTYIWEGEN